MDIGPGDLQGNQHLDHELVARRRNEVRWGAKPVGQLVVASGRDPVPLLRSLAFPVVGLDESVPFEALEGRVDLPDVERPHLAGPRLELALQPQAVLRPLTQQGKEGMGDAHEWLHGDSILSTIPGIDKLVQVLMRSRVAEVRSRGAALRRVRKLGRAGFGAIRSAGQTRWTRRRPLHEFANPKGVRPAAAPAAAGVVRDRRGATRVRLRASTALGSRPVRARATASPRRRHGRAGGARGQSYSPRSRGGSRRGIGEALISEVVVSP